MYHLFCAFEWYSCRTFCKLNTLHSVRQLYHSNAHKRWYMSYLHSPYRTFDNCIIRTHKKDDTCLTYIRFASCSLLCVGNFIVIVFSLSQCTTFALFCVCSVIAVVPISWGEGWDHINKSNPDTYLCLSQARTWISNVILRFILLCSINWGESWYLVRLVIYWWTCWWVFCWKWRALVIHWFFRATSNILKHLMLWQSYRLHSMP
jgi:hypothetical protein